MRDGVKRDNGLKVLGEVKGTEQAVSARKATGQRIPRTAILHVNQLDHAHRSVPPKGGQRHVSRYAGRNLVAEAVAALYGEESRAEIAGEIAKEQPAVRRDIKASATGTASDRPSVAPKGPGKKPTGKEGRKRRFFGF